MKYFPDCYRYDEGELNRILSVALQTRECQQIISKIKAESRETTPPQSTLTNAQFLHHFSVLIFPDKWEFTVLQ